jgi:hypothetical protein
VIVESAAQGDALVRVDLAYGTVDVSGKTNRFAGREGQRSLQLRGERRIPNPRPAIEDESPPARLDAKVVAALAVRVASEPQAGRPGLRREQELDLDPATARERAGGRQTEAAGGGQGRAIGVALQRS